MNRLTESFIADVVGITYETILDDSAWGRLLSAINSKFPALIGTIHFAPRTLENAVFAEHNNAPSDWVQLYADYYHKVNPFKYRVVNLPPSQVICTDEIFDRGDFLKTEYYNDYFVQRDVRLVYGLKLSDTPNFQGIMALLVPHHAEADYVPDLPVLLHQLRPHVQRAVALRAHRIEDLEKRGHALLLDSIRTPALLIDEDGQVLSANQGGRELIAQSPAAAQRSRLVTGAGSVPERSRLELALGAALKSGRPGAPHAITLSPNRRVVAHVIPVAQETTPWRKIDRMFFRSTHAAAVAYIVDPTAPRPIESSDISTVFGLSAAETRVAEALASGLSLAEYAAERGISKNTARVQLAAAMSKMGVSRQAELVARLAQLQTP